MSSELSADAKVLERSDECYFRHNKITTKFKTRDWSGFSCYIIGGGPSLSGFDFNRLKGKITIGINRSFEFFESTILYFMDYEFYRTVTDGGEYSKKVLGKWNSFNGEIVGISSFSPTLNFGNEVSLVRRRLSPAIDYNLDAGIYGGSCSGVGALMLAAQLGAENIYLLGMDLQASETIHWHSGYNNQDHYAFNARCKEYIKDFERTVPVLRMRGIKVFNCSPQSALSCFPKISLDEALI